MKKNETTYVETHSSRCRWYVRRTYLAEYLRCLSECPHVQNLQELSRWSSLLLPLSCNQRPLFPLKEQFPFKTHVHIPAYAYLNLISILKHTSIKKNYQSYKILVEKICLLMKFVSLWHFIIYYGWQKVYWTLEGGKVFCWGEKQQKTYHPLR